MADKTVKWTCDADTKKFLDKVLSATQALKGMDTAASKAQKRVNVTFGDGAASVGKFITQIAGIGSVMAGTMAIINQVKNEYDHLVSRRREAADAQVTAAQARNYAMLNLPGDVDWQTVEPKLRSISKTSKMDMTELWRGLGPTFSGRGDLEIGKMWDAYTEAATLSAKTGGMAELGVLSGRGMDIMRYTGGDSKTALGWLLQVGVQSRVQDINKQAEGLVSALSMASALGMSQEQAAEFFAFNTVKSGSTEGERDATFVAGLLGAMKNNEIKIPYKGYDKNGSLTTLWRKPKSTEFDAQMQEFREFYNDPNTTEDMQNAFMGKIPGRERTKGGFMGLISGSQQALDSYAHIQKMIPSPLAEENAAFYEQKLSIMSSGGMKEKVRELSQTADSILSNVQLENNEALRGTIQAKLEKAMDIVPGESDLEEKLHKLSMVKLAATGGKDVDYLDAGIDILTQLKEGSHLQKYMYGSRNDFVRTGVDKTGYPTSHRRRNIKPRYVDYADELPNGAEYDRRMDLYQIGRSYEKNAFWADNPDHNDKILTALDALIDEFRQTKNEIVQMRADNARRNIVTAPEVQ